MDEVEPSKKVVDLLASSMRVDTKPAVNDLPSLVIVSVIPERYISLSDKDVLSIKNEAFKLQSVVESVAEMGAMLLTSVILSVVLSKVYR